MNRRFARIVLACCVAGALALPAAAQNTAKKKVIRGDSIDGPAAGDTTTNAAAPAAAPAPAPTTLAKITPATTPAPAPATSGSGGKDTVVPVEFTKLSGYEYLVPDTPNTNQLAGADVADKQIPAEVKALNGKKVAVIGYLMPLKEEEGKSTEFLLMRTQSSCCFGIPPTITELITVKAAGKGVPTIMDDLIEIQGTLKVGTVREEGYIVGVYRMEEGKYMGRSDR
jgi:hypothetical protein